MQTIKRINITLNQRDFFNKMAHKWDEICYHNEDKINQILDVLDINEGDSILDVGMGTGVLTSYLAARTGKTGIVHGVDISEKMIELARAKHSSKLNILFTVTDVNDMRMTGQYDKIVCYSCFPHFVDKEQTVRHMAKGLVNSGKLMIAHSQSRKEINKRHQKRIETEHNILPSVEEIEAMMAKGGLKTGLNLDNEEMFFVMGSKSPDVARSQIKLS